MVYFFGAGDEMTLLPNKVAFITNGIVLFLFISSPMRRSPEFWVWEFCYLFIIWYCSFNWFKVTMVRVMSKEQVRNRPHFIFKLELLNSKEFLFPFFSLPKGISRKSMFYQYFKISCSPQSKIR